MILTYIKLHWASFNQFATHLVTFICTSELDYNESNNGFLAFEAKTLTESMLVYFYPYPVTDKYAVSNNKAQKNDTQTSLFVRNLWSPLVLVSCKYQDTKITLK